MIKATDRKLVVGLEIGTAKVAALVGEVLPDGMINIIGVGSCPSRGMDKGGVNDLESVVKCVQRAIDQAELMADCQISSVYLALSGKHISCQNEIGMVPISEEEVTQDDVENVVHTAKSVRVRDEHRVLHVIPQEYAIDYQEGIKNPVGLSGVRMQAKVHLITCHNDMAKNIVKAVERCGLKVDQLIFAGLAASYSVLTEDERELGVCVVDIGGGTMDIAVYTGGALRHTKVIPYAGNVVTSDIAYAFGTPPSDAEAIKVRHGCALGSIVGKDENVEVPSVGGRPPRSLQRQTLAEVIEPRYTELLNLVNEEILQLQEQLRQQGVKHHLAAGIVLTGGAAPVVAEVAKDLGILTVAVVTKPFNFEGKKRMAFAEQGITELSKHVDSLITIPNDKLLKVLGRGISLLDAFGAANDVLKGAVQGIAELITRPGLMNVDFADVRTVMSEMGYAMMGSGVASGEDRAEEAAEMAISSPLLEDIDLSGARGVLVNITAGFDLRLDEFETVGNTIRAFASDNATVVIGTSLDPDMNDELRVTVVATGIGMDKRPEITLVTNKQVQQPVMDRYQQHGMSPLTQEQKPAAKVVNDNTPQTAKEPDYLDIPAFLRKQAD